MSESPVGETQRRKKRYFNVIGVPVQEDDDRLIKANAKKAGHSVADFLRQLGRGYVPRGILDHEAVQELAKINGDQGRLGGLLKLWLAKNEKVEQFENPHATRVRINALLSNIEAAQELLQATMKRVVGL